MDAKVIAPPALAATLPADRVIPFAPKIVVRRDHGRARPHAARRPSTTTPISSPGTACGSTSPATPTRPTPCWLSADLDVAFVSPWLLEASRRRRPAIDARRVVVYHHEPTRRCRPSRTRLVPKQSDVLTLSRGADVSRSRAPARGDAAHAGRAPARDGDALPLFAPTRTRPPPSCRTRTSSTSPGIETSPGAVLAIDGPAKESLALRADEAARAREQNSDREDRAGRRLRHSGWASTGSSTARSSRAFSRGDRKRRPALFLYARGVSDAHGFPLDIALDDPDAAWNHALGGALERRTTASRRLDARRNARDQGRGRDRRHAPRRCGQREGADRRHGRAAPGPAPARGRSRRRVGVHRRRRGRPILLALGDDGTGERFSGALRIPRSTIDT